MAQASSLLQFLIVVLAARLARQQESFVEYLKAENRVLKARLGRRRVIFTDAERRLLARHAKAVGRKRLSSSSRSSRRTRGCGGTVN